MKQSLSSCLLRKIPGSILHKSCSKASRLQKRNFQKDVQRRLQYSSSRNASNVSSILWAYSLTEKVFLHCPQRNTTPRQVCTACNGVPQSRQDMVVCTARAERDHLPGSTHDIATFLKKYRFSRASADTPH